MIATISVKDNEGKLILLQDIPIIIGETSELDTSLSYREGNIIIDRLYFKVHASGFSIREDETGEDDATSS